MNEQNAFEFEKAQEKVRELRQWIWDNMLAFQRVSDMNLMKTNLYRALDASLKQITMQLGHLADVEMAYDPKERDA